MKTSFSQLLRLSEKLLQEEIEKTGFPFLENHRVALIYGRRLAKRYKVDADFICACLNFMDLKVGEAFLNHRLEDHIQMSLDATLAAIKPLQLGCLIIQKIKDCILCHHGVDSYPSVEAEICANADCFKFLHPRGGLTMIAGLMAKGLSFEEAVSLLEEKIEEKLKIVSLPELKKEASSYARLWQKILPAALSLKG